jgi:glycosyltransferase involved in cell wall biosynthesis
VTRPALFISWSVQHGRSRDLAAALGAEAVFVGIRRRRRRWLSPLRYVASAAVTTRLLVARRPSAIFVMTPPVPLAVLALTYGRLARVPVALDAHTGAALAMRTGRPRRSLRVLGRLATVTIVTNSQLADPLDARGVTTAILHDPPVLVAEPSVDAANAPGDFSVVAPLSWAPDEPIDQILDAARRLPHVRFVATGRAPAAVRERADLPPNLELAGFLDDAAFGDLMSGAGVVLALTTRDATMQRAGYEAMAMGRPVIASDTRVLREFFGDAALYAGSGEQLAAAITQCRSRGAELAAAMRARRVEVRADFDRAIGEIAHLMRLPPRG